MRDQLWEKTRESLLSVLPIALIVLALHVTVAPLSTGTFQLFLIGTVLLIVGMGLFQLGADLSMMPMGERIGNQLSRSRRRVPVLLLCVLIGTFVTLAEPDLTVLAGQVPSMPSSLIIWTVALGVGVFLAVAMARILFKWPLRRVLTIVYLGLFAVAAFVPADFLPVAFDSGGVTTGPITVPFIMALGIGVASVRGGSTEEDNFGMVALCSVGPMLVMSLLGIFYQSESTYVASASPEVASLGEAALLFVREIPHTMREVLWALLPVVALFLLFQIISLRLPTSQLLRMGVGLIYTYVGLVLFLTGVNIGFLPAGSALGAAIAGLSNPFWLVPIGMLMGACAVIAEPAVHVLNRQVSEITVGAISERSMMVSLSAGVAVSVGISMFRVVTQFPLWPILLVGYGAALLMMRFVPGIFTAVAFDSGGVASGPMTATFMLPFAIGACTALGGNIMRDAFGLVAMVALTPLITVQLMGLIYNLKQKRAPALQEVEAEVEIFDFDWEVA